MSEELRLHRVGGVGSDVLLLHGFGADRMSWLANQYELSQVANVHACDLPAHGDQPALCGEVELSDIANAVIGGLESLRRSCVLVGHSLGGSIAVEVAARCPQLVSGLALLSPAGLGNGVDQDFLERFPDLSDRDPALAMLRRLVVRPRLIAPSVADRLLQHLAQPAIRPALRTIARKLVQVDVSLQPHLAAVVASSVPRLVIWGEQDGINQIHRAKLAEFGGQVVSLPETGHLPHIESSKAVNDALTNFLNIVGEKR
ncbi:alpha/beta fold hydrolase [Bradyrhizobium sp. C-145]|uniref:alpha/beta fold hydrolase n=1 Tax=Bradyrhizobium sp. C-145 TaxID=574727 RepID=UPI00201B7946|nr:alpha/beta fold hydrolase [Bradyrhizobium sp. C-145]UQR61451.1 alpha/beta fold hydrolase [Bradyrhizobium sp. C-145]